MLASAARRARPSVLVSLIAIVVLCTFFGVRGPKPDRGYVFEDQRVSIAAVRYMQHGLGYYPAMDKSMTEAKVGPVATARSFRMPTIYLLWRWLPAPGGLWALFVAMIGVTGLLLLVDTPVPLAAPIAVAYLLNVGRQQFTGLWLMVEFWPLPFVAAFLVAWRRERWRLAALLALAAFLVRELTLGLVVGGLVTAWRRRLDVRPWVVALGAAAAALATHWLLASRYLVAHGHEAPLVGTGSFPISSALMTGFLLPASSVTGPVLWALAVWRLARTRMLLPLSAYLALPVLGVWVQRPYWGILLVPFTMVWAAEAVVDLTEAVRARRLVAPRPAAGSPRP